MKCFLIFTCIFFLFVLPGNAQSKNDTAIQRQSYVFDDFIIGKVLMKTGEINQAPLNYCSYDQTILFKKDGQTMTLTGLEAIDTVYISGKKFIPVGNIVYEVIDGIGKVALLVSYKSKMVPWTATADHNGSSRKQNNEVSNTVSNVYVSRIYKGDFSLLITKHYWLKDYNKIYKANSLKDFLKVFKENVGEDIAEFVKQNHIDFSKEADLMKLVDFANNK